MNQTFDFFSKLTDASDWPPRWHCGKWTDFHGWLYIGSDLLIWMAYFAIPIVIIKYISKRQGAKFIRLYFLFAAFILACGTTHFLDAVAFWYPAYRLGALFRFITAVVSWATVFYLVKYLPVAFSLKSEKDFLTEIQQRQKAEEALHLLNATLEQRVKDRTAELENTLREVQDYKYALDESAIVAITDQKGKIRYVNDNFCKVSKYSRKELVGQDHRIINSGYHSKEFIAGLWRTIANGDTWRGELKNKAKDGTIYWVDTTIVPFLNDEGKPYQYVAIRYDITARKKLEEELALFPLIIDSSDDAIISKNLYGIITSWNKAAEKIFGYHAHEIIGKPVTTLIPAHLHEEEKGLLEKLKSGQIVDHFETVRVTKTGEVIDVSLTISPVRDAAGNIVGASKILRDVTKQKLADKKLAASLKELQDYKYALDEVASVVIVNSNLETIYVNETFYKALEYDKKEVLGHSMRDFITAFNNHNIIDNAVEVIKKGKIWRGEIKNRTKTGKDLWFDTTVIPFLDAEGKPYQFLSIRRDITERKQAEAQVQLLLKELGDYKYALDQAAIVTISDRETIIKDVNDKFCKTLQFSKEELIGKSLQYINSEYHSKEYISRLVKTIKSGKVWQGEIINLAKDGTYHWFHTTIVPFLDEHSQPYQYLSIRTEITDRKLAEEKLQQSLKELQDYRYALDEAATVAITDQNGIIKHVNDNFCRISKYSREELLGQDHRIVNSGFHSKEFIKHLWETITSGRIWRGELKNRAKDGVTYWLDTTIVPFLDDQGKPYQYLAIRYDITDRKTAETYLNNLLIELRDYKYAVDESAIVIITDQDKNIKHVNERFCDTLQYSRDELVGKNFAAVNSSINGKELVDEIVSTISGGEIWKGEIQGRAKDGTTYWFDNTVVPFLDEYGKPYQFLSIRTDITERKLAQEKLEKSIKEVRDYKYALDETALVAIVDKTKNIMYVNEIFCNVYKYTREELLGKSFGEFNSRFNPPELITELVKTVDSGKIWRGELKGVDREGGIHWFDNTTVPFLDTDGIPYQFVVIRIEITERKLAEERVVSLHRELEQSEKRFRALIEHSKDVFVIARNEKLTFVSSTVEPILGYTPEEYSRISLENIVHPDSLPLQWNSLSNTGDLEYLEFKIKHKNGSWRWMEGTGINLLGVDGVDGIVYNYRDVTMRKEAEQRLAESARIYKTIASNIPGAFICIFDKEHRYLLAEGELLLTIGYNKEKLPGQRVEDVIPPTYFNEFISCLEKAFRGETFIKETHRGQVDLLYNYVPFSLHHNEVQEVMVVGIDVTELKKAQRELSEWNLMLEQKVQDRTIELEKANKELEAFSYSVSHDLRTPLRAIHGYSRMLEEDYTNCLDAEGNRLLAVIEYNAKRMGDLIDDLLEFARLGKKEVQKTNVNMNALAKTVVDDLLADAHYRADIHIDYMLPAYADAALIRQVLFNFISNALKYSSKKENPVVTIRSQQEGNEVIYCVQDNGTGFDMQYQRKLFNVFERLHSIEEFEGTGVGLATVKRIIDKHNGRVWARGEVDKGATFCFALPVKTG